jgi:hypothetical protein
MIPISDVRLRYRTRLPGENHRAFHRTRNNLPDFYAPLHTMSLVRKRTARRSCHLNLDQGIYLITPSVVSYVRQLYPYRTLLESPRVPLNAEHSSQKFYACI